MSRDVCESVDGSSVRPPVRSQRFTRADTPRGSTREEMCTYLGPRLPLERGESAGFPVSGVSLFFPCYANLICT